MSAARGRSRRRWLTGGIVVLAVLVVAAGVLLIRDRWFTDRAREVTVDEAVERYRASTSTSTSPVTDRSGPGTVAASPGAPATTGRGATTPPTSGEPGGATTTVVPVALEVPPPGIYRYRTSGEESIDALGGTTHQYPSETTITVTRAGCGVRLRWDALQERREEWSLCPAPSGIELQVAAIQYHEFYGRGEAEDLTCDRPVVVVPLDPAATPGPQPQSCRLADDPWLPVWTIHERSTIDVDGRPVEVVHVRMSIEDDDDYWEHNTIDVELAADPALAGLPVRAVATKESRSPSIVGPVVYHEQYTLDLVSTTPLR